MSEKNIAIIRRFYEAVFITGKMNPAAIDQYLTADFVGHDLPAGLEGREGYKKFVSMLAASFSEMSHLEACDMIDNGDRVAVRWSSAGRHTGEFMGIPATGRQVTVKGIDIFRLAGDKIADLWQEIDIMGILEQISAPTLRE